MIITRFLNHVEKSIRFIIILSGSCIALLLSTSSKALCQDTTNKEGAFKYSIYVSGNIVAPATVKKYEGAYSLNSLIQSNYSLGLSRLFRYGKRDYLSFGLALVVGKKNIYANIPDADLGALNASGQRLIEDKDIYAFVQLPVSYSHLFSLSNKNLILGTLGCRLNYTGFVPKEYLAAYVSDNSGQYRLIYSSESFTPGDFFWSFSGSFQYPLWMTPTHRLFAGLKMEIAIRHFEETAFEITIPDKPITRGIFKNSSSSLGIEIIYQFPKKQPRK